MSKPTTLRKLIAQELADGAKSPRTLSETLATPLRVIHTKLTGMSKDGQVLSEFLSDGKPRMYRLNPRYAAPPTTQELQRMAKQAKAEHYAANVVKSTYRPDRMGTTYVPPKTEGVRYDR